MTMGLLGVLTLLAAQAVVVPVNVPQPVYPPIAQSARIDGRVVIAVVVRPDGSVASADIESGAPMLQAAALEAAQRSQYDCRGCTEPGTPYSLVFEFHLTVRTSPIPPAGLTFAQDGSATVKVEGRIPLASDGVVRAYKRPAPERTRSHRCLWLWKCGRLDA